MVEPSWTWQCELELPSKTGAGSCFVEDVVKQLEQAQWEQHDIFSIQLALEEALVNAVKHGNRLDLSKRVFVRCKVARDVIHVEVADEGEGFDPHQVPDPTDPEFIENPHGRGILLMRSFMSLVDYNEKGNQVTLEKRRSEPAPLPS